MARPNQGKLYYVSMSDSSYPLGGSAYAQLKNCVGSQVPDVSDAVQFKASFNGLQDRIKKGKFLLVMTLGLADSLQPYSKCVLLKIK